ncbi:uncharacterized protein LOC111125487 isoform X4 [Crassostrea virginica]
MATMDTAPPSYEEARNEGQTIKGLDPQPPRYSDPESQMPTPSEPPPSYESIYGRVKAAQLEAESKPQFFKKVMTIIMGTLGCTICLGIILAIPISMIVMGGVYYNDCLAVWRIPLYLIVMFHPLIVGGVYYNDCLAEWRIPLYLIVMFHPLFVGGVYYNDCLAEWSIPLYLIVMFHQLIVGGVFYNDCPGE